MPDLHGWIVQQIDKVEASTHSATPGPWSADTDDDTVFAAAGTVARMWDYVRSGSDVQVKADMELIIVHADPDAVLRRCAADRKILARHRLNPDAYWSEAAMCVGCGTTSDCDWPVTDNLNDCPELLDLGHAHGLTPEILAGLDRPQRGERPDYPGETGNVVHDSITSMYGALYKQAMETTFASISAAENILVTGDPTVEPRLWARKIPGAPIPEWLREDLGLPVPEPEPTPADRAFAILEPHLRDVPLYRPKYARGGILPKGFGATADRPPELLRDPHWRLHP